MQFQSRQVNLDRFAGQFRYRTVRGEQGHLFPLPLSLLNDLNGFDLGGLLAIVDLAEIKNMTLDNLVIYSPMIFNDTPVAVIFSVFEPPFDSKKHAPNLP
jgi:hypothetical protein